MQIRNAVTHKANRDMDVDDSQTQKEPICYKSSIFVLIRILLKFAGLLIEDIDGVIDVSFQNVRCSLQFCCNRSQLFAKNFVLTESRFKIEELHRRTLHTVKFFRKITQPFKSIITCKALPQRNAGGNALFAKPFP